MNSGDSPVGEDETAEEFSVSPCRVSDFASDTTSHSSEDPHSLWMPLDTEEPSEGLLVEDSAFDRGGNTRVNALAGQAIRDKGSFPSNPQLLTLLTNIPDDNCRQAPANPLDTDVAASDFDITQPQKEAVVEAMRNVSIEYVPQWASTLREEEWLLRLRNHLVERQHSMGKAKEVG